MRERGVSTVGAIVLGLVILACVGFIVYWLGKAGPPPPPESSGAAITHHACAAKGCGWRADWTREQAAAAERGPGFNGAKELVKCPKCGKFSVGKYKLCSACGVEFWDLGKGCSHCAKAGK